MDRFTGNLAPLSEHQKNPLNAYQNRLKTLFTLTLLLISWSAEAQDGLNGMVLPAGFQAFHPESPWNSRIAANPKLAFNSSAMMKKLQREAGYLKLDHAQWSIPLFVINADEAPLVSVQFEGTSNPLTDPDGSGAVENLPIPPGVWADPQRDGHLLLVDPEQMLSWDFSRMTKLGDGRWQASRIDIWDLTEMGQREPFAGKTWWSYGARGSGMPLLAGLVLLEEIRAGEIRHALVFASPTTRKSSFPNGPLELCPPASRTDGDAVGLNTLPMGVRLQLDPSLDLDALKLSPEVKVIARALQEYGMFNGDSTYDTFKIYLQNLGRDGGAWADIDFDSLAKIPLDRFRVLACPRAIKQL